jgi:hypothetical protein
VVSWAAGRRPWRKSARTPRRLRRASNLLRRARRKLVEQVEEVVVSHVRCEAENCPESASFCFVITRHPAARTAKGRSRPASLRTASLLGTHHAPLGRSPPTRPQDKPSRQRAFATAAAAAGSGIARSGKPRTLRGEGKRRQVRLQSCGRPTSVGLRERAKDRPGAKPSQAVRAGLLLSEREQSDPVRHGFGHAGNASASKLIGQEQDRTGMPPGSRAAHCAT